MNFKKLILSKNSLYALCIVTFSLFLKTPMQAQSGENAKQLKNEISQTKSNVKKIELLLKLSSYYLTKDGELKADMDSAGVLNFQARELSNVADYKIGIGKSILLSAQIYREKGEKEKSISYTNNALAYSKKNNIQILEADCYRELCAFYGNEKEDLLKKIAYCELAVPIYKKEKALKKEADALKDLGDYYGNIGDSQKSLLLLDSAISIYKVVGFKAIQGTYTLMSSNYGILGNAQLSLKYALMAEKTAEDLNDTSYQWCSIYNHLALAYYDLRKFDLALSNFEKSLNVALKYKNVGDINTISFNLSTLHYQQKNYSEALRIVKLTVKDFPPTDNNTRIWQRFIFLVSHSKLQQLSSAKPYYEEMLKDYNANRDSDINLKYRLVGIIIYLQQSGQSEKTYPYLDHFKEFAKRSNKLSLFSQFELLAFQSDYESKKYEPAIKHLQQYQVFRDSIFNLERQKQSSALQLQFETEKKDKNIKLLTEQGKTQEIKIHNDTILRYVFIASVIVLVLFIGLIYNRYRLKQRSTKRLENKQEEINLQNEQLKKLLIEKEWLLKEIHHRVKNNLQIVISLLNTQSAYLDNEDALMAIQNSQHRMHAMSLIHQKLYQSNNLASIDMSWYIYELINYMKECFGTEKKINFILDTEKVDLDVAQAVPLGLIINEAINNTIKYAFPLDRKGNVVVSLKNLEENKYKLMISDNGIGLPAHFNIEETESLGMNLMRGLSDQLDASFYLSNENGLKIEITFTKNIEFEASAENSTLI